MTLKSKELDALELNVSVAPHHYVMVGGASYVQVKGKEAVEVNSEAHTPTAKENASTGQLAKLTEKVAGMEAMAREMAQFADRMTASANSVMNEIKAMEKARGSELSA